MSNRRPGCTQRELLADIAHQAMIDRGLEPDFPPDAQKQADSIAGPAKADGGVRDLRQMLWCSIDNDDSRDLDQLTFAEGDDKATKVYVAVADVDEVV
ncbi:MAG: RNB domain-containing ribonuclease, partial [Thermoanaerobaculia bacterium]